MAAGGNNTYYLLKTAYLVMMLEVRKDATVGKSD
jgi:hypothetical protein